MESCQGSTSSTLAGFSDMANSEFASLPPYEEDAALRRWHELLVTPLFRNTLAGFERRALSDTNHGFVALFDATRAKTKRQPTPQKALRPAVVRPFDPSGFHFGKARADERIARFYGPSAADPSVWCWHAVFVNVSPLAEGHVVLVPDLELHQLPQVLSHGAVRLLVRFAARGTRQDFKVLFNSLGGWASVNSLHIHGLFTSELFPERQGRFPIECAPRGEGAHISSHGVDVDVLRLQYAVEAWVVTATASVGTLEETVLDILATAVWLIVERLQALDVPHHLLATQGGRRIYVVPRQMQRDLPEGIKFAVMEVLGTAICSSDTGYSDLTAEHYFALLKEEVSLTPEQMRYIEEEVFRRLIGSLGAEFDQLQKLPKLVQK